MARLIDSRKDDRKPLNVSIEFKGRRKLINALSYNLSLGGVFVATKEPLKVTEKVFVKLKAKEKPVSFNLEGEVVWNNGRGCGRHRRDLPTGMGIKFSDSRNLNKKTIKNFLDFIEQSTFSMCV